MAYPGGATVQTTPVFKESTNIFSHVWKFFWLLHCLYVCHATENIIFTYQLEVYVRTPSEALNLITCHFKWFMVKICVTMLELSSLWRWGDDYLYFEQLNKSNIPNKNIRHINTVDIWVCSKLISVHWIVVQSTCHHSHRYHTHKTASVWHQDSSALTLSHPKNEYG